MKEGISQSMVLSFLNKWSDLVLDPCRLKTERNNKRYALNKNNSYDQ